MKKEKITISSGDEVIPLCIELLIARLRSNDGAERTHAREALVKIGRSAVPFITPLLSHNEDHVRWEACKTLQHIRDPKTAPLLASLLMDDDMDVRWVAAEALIELEHHSIVPLLEIVRKHFDSVMLRDAAHHVLHSLKENELLDDQTVEMLHALKMYELPSKAAFVANKVLEHIRSRAPEKPRRTVIHKS